MAMEEIESNRTTPKDSDGKRCYECGVMVALKPEDPRWRQLDVHCDACEKVRYDRSAQRREEELQSRKAAILSRIPSAFLKTERDKLPHPEKLDAAMRWTFGSRGLLLYGATGCGKSRVAWEIAKREVLAGKSFKCVNAFELARYPSMLMADSAAAEAFASELVKIDLLMLDDVFKAKPTERIEELLFAVIDERGGWDRPCIVTLNDTGDTLTNRLSSDRGPALIRRLRDYCESLSF